MVRAEGLRLASMSWKINSGCCVCMWRSRGVCVSENKRANKGSKREKGTRKKEKDRQMPS